MAVQYGMMWIAGCATNLWQEHYPLQRSSYAIRHGTMLAQQ